MRNGHTAHVISLISQIWVTPQDSLLPKYLEDITGKLDAFEKFLGDKQFFAGDKVTFVDFPMYELLDQHRVLKDGCLKDHPKLAAFMDRFEVRTSTLWHGVDACTSTLRRCVEALYEYAMLSW